MVEMNVNFSMFCDAFSKMGRKDNFSYEGLKALFEYLEQLSDDIGEDIELDVIALCSEYTEYSDIDEIKNTYDCEFEDVEELRDYTQVIEFKGGIIIQDF